MSRCKKLRDHIVILLPILLFVPTTLVDAGTSSTPKNLVNLYHSPNDNLNITSLNQNDFQYRQSIQKSTTSDRYKSTTPGFETNPDHPYDELSSATTLDYLYQDNRGTTNVPECKGRLKLNGTRGFITDGPRHYQTNLQCTWLIDSGRKNVTIRIQFHQFNTECNYDYLYIFDGDSIYSPLVAALSGDMKDFSTAFMNSKYANKISQHDNLTQTNYNASADLATNSAIIPIISTDSIELKTLSGSAFIYFHSDTAQTMSGFYLTYSIDSCPLDCSNKGECDLKQLTCKCNIGYFGEGCQHKLCPNNCTSPDHGVCDKDKSCVCNEGYYGTDCSMKNDHQTWVKLSDLITNVPYRAFHQALVVDGKMWVIGGKDQSLSNTNMGLFKQKETVIIFSFDMISKQWSDTRLLGITGIDHLAEVSGHSAAAKGDKIFIFGGIAMNNTILNTLTVFDTKTNSLAIIPGKKRTKLSEEEFIAPIAVVGHSATIVDSHMYIFLGYNPLYGYINFVQKFNLADNTWSFVERKGSSIIGSFGHSSTYDPIGKLIYVYGGHNANRLSSLHSFDPHTESWTLLQASPSPRYYHSSLILNGRLIVLGGNSYNTTHQSDQCFQHTYLAYDLACSKTNLDTRDQSNSTGLNMNCGNKCWQSIEDSEPGIMKRHGHSVINYHEELVLFGGFNGVMLNDIRFMNLSKCETFSKQPECSKPRIFSECIWNTIDGKCEEKLSGSRNILAEASSYNCTKSDLKLIQNACESRETCTDCLNTNLGCVWCGFLSHCQHNKCKSSNSKAVQDPDLCYKDEFLKNSLMGMSFGAHIPIGQEFDIEMDCKRLDNCFLCHSKPQCSWQNEGCVYSSPNAVISGPSASLSPAPQEDINDIYNNQIITSKAEYNATTRLIPRFNPFNRTFVAAFTSLLNPSPYHQCEAPCFTRRSCNECVSKNCIWCSTSDQCLDSSAYFAYHAMGQCMHYVAHSLKCPVSSCADIEACDKCLTNPKCGWLNDISNTGKGRCIEGTSSGPFFGNSPTIESNSTVGSGFILPNWFYTSCPSCQCNGHSFCKPNSSVCTQPCLDNTEGNHCDKCIQGFYGDPVNGGSCRPCRCNGHAQVCNRETGKCYCSTKGIIGHNCNRCDDQNHYIGDFSNPTNGTCYYNLTTDYQYTFNMSKTEDLFYSDINFINVPLRKDTDIDFTIGCSGLALVNISSGTSYKSRRPIHTSLECGSFRLRFPHDRHFLTETNYSFFVHVYKFQTPFILQIAFSQHRTLYLPQFFFTFSSCFLFFFALSGLIWKLKHEYDLYVRRQQHYIEMEQMASRPFSTILLEIFKPTSGGGSDQLLKRTAEPTPISFEPCFGNNIGVLSLFVQLPGKPNLAIGSALVTLNDDNSNSCDDNLNKRHPSGSNIYNI